MDVFIDIFVVVIVVVVAAAVVIVVKLQGTYTRHMALAEKIRLFSYTVVDFIRVVVGNIVWKWL